MRLISEPRRSLAPGTLAAHWRASPSDPEEHPKHAGAAIIYSDHLTGADGAAMFEHVCRLGLEGIVAKRRKGRYRSGRC